MITISFKNIVKNDEIDLDRSIVLNLEISGHSGINKKGSDILCSAVSALAQTFVLTVSRVLKIKQTIVKKEGYLSTSISLKEVDTEDKAKLKLLIESLMIGLLEIRGEYPDKIKIEFVND